MLKTKYTFSFNYCFAIFIVPLLFPLFSFLEKDFDLIKSIHCNGDYITSDKLGNIYIVEEHILWKFDENGKLLKSYSSIDAGNISSIDASDPLKILLFYQDFAIIELLDNTLSLSGSSIMMGNYEYGQATLACTSYNNAFWIYDSDSFRLIRFDNNLQIKNKSIEIINIIEEEINPDYIIEIGNHVYLNNPETGVIVFDRYGAYLKTLPFKGLKSFQLIDDVLIYFNKKALKSFNLKTTQSSSSSLPVENPVDIRIENNKLYLLLKDQLNIYSIK